MKSKYSVLLLLNISAIFIFSDVNAKFNRSECRDAGSSEGLVVGGFKFARDKWPWLVALFIKDQETFFGAGSLISESFVITAAHCLQNKKQTTAENPDNVIVYLGIHNLSAIQDEGVVEVTPKEFFIHSDWDPLSSRFDADIAVIKLSQEVSLNRHVQPICLWTFEDKPFGTRDGGTVVGWGSMGIQGSGEYPEVPRQASLNVHPISKCYETLGIRDAISSRGLCVGGEGTGPCFGDSGGGFFSYKPSKWFLRGITSSSVINGFGHCDIGTPAVFTDVNQFSKWINQILDGAAQLNCEFYYDSIRMAYACSPKQLSITTEDTEIVQALGKHGEHQTNDDVNILHIKDQLTPFLPVKLSNIFSELLFYMIESSGVKNISRKHLKDLIKLRFFILILNPLKAIPRDLFYDLADLEVLSLRDNQIEILDSRTFIYNTKLKVIVLNNNKIRSLDGSIFVNNLNLNRIQVNNNLLTFIGSKLLKPLMKVDELFFANNTCIDAFSNSSESALTKQQLEEIFGKNCQETDDYDDLFT